MRLSWILLPITLLLPQSALAWGDLGHTIVCEIAFQELQQSSPTAAAEVARLIAGDGHFNTFAESCTGPDHPHVRDVEHYINVPRDAETISSTDCPMADECLFTAIT